MNTETIIHRIIDKNGTLRLHPRREDDLKKHNDFLVSHAADVQSGKNVYVRATYEIVSEQYVQFYTRRSHLHAYIHNVIENGYEEFVNGIHGKSPEEKADTLYEQLKSAYCQVKVCERFSLADSAVGKKDKMSYNDAINICEWMISHLSQAHEMVAGWTVPARRDDE